MLPSGLPEHVADPEPLSRFLTSDSQFSNRMPKASAFMPGPADAKTSVLRQAVEPLADLWGTDDREIGPTRRVRAAALLTAADVRTARLDVEAHEPPPPAARELVGWPSVVNDVEHTKAQRKEFALLLARAANLIRR